MTVPNADDAEETNAWDRVERLLGNEALAQLAKKSVAVVGLGSGGGFVALSLAMSGVGRFVLIDDDQVALTNVVRHVADLRDVGRPKVEAVADLIKQRSPSAQVETVVGRIEDHTTELNDVDLVVVGVDGELVKYTINEVCRAEGLPAIYAGVYERGEGGDVVLIHPDHGPCYACWARQLREDVASQSAKETTDPGEADLDYGMIGPDGTIAAEPGLWLHVVRVASAQADMALNELLEGQPIHRDLPANTVILANVPMEILEGITASPYSAQWINVERDPDCMVCGDEASREMSLDTLAGDLMTESDDDVSETHEANPGAKQTNGETDHDR
jgi:molybdopterin/thiamine biosynthesis adenylyltransferase